jgi:hypothetical protein
MRGVWAGAGVPDAAGDGRGHAAATVSHAADGAAQLRAASAGQCGLDLPAQCGMNIQDAGQKRLYRTERDASVSERERESTPLCV